MCVIWMCAGSRAAFSPITGAPEPFALDSAGKRASNASTVRTVWAEEGDDEGEDDKLVERMMWRMLGDERTSFELCEEEHIYPTELGTAYFEIGERSRGPRHIDLASALDPATALYAPTVCVFDTCLHDGAQRRARTKLSIALSAADTDDDINRKQEHKSKDEEQQQLAQLELSVLSLAVNVEDWAGPADTRMAERVAQEHFTTMEPLSEATPLDPRQLAGNWRVLERAAFPTTDHNGEPTFSWKSNEIEEVWSVPAEPSDAYEEPGDAGWALWLPNNLWCGIEHTCNGGIRIKVGWLLRKNVQQIISREYDSSGKLEKISASSAAASTGTR